MGFRYQEKLLAVSYQLLAISSHAIVLTADGH